MDLKFLVNIVVCFILSFFIGLERQRRRRTIGLRTNVLVSLGSFLFVTLSVKLNVLGDSTRVAAQVVSGIGFLGAGVILKDGVHIRGLNTAATLWCNSAIGILCAYGFIEEAVVGTIFILACNIILRSLALKMIDLEIQNDSNYIFSITCKEKYTTNYRREIIEIINKTNMLLDKVETEEIDTNKFKTRFYISSRNAVEIEKMVAKFGSDANILSVSWKMVSEDYKKEAEADEL